MQLRRTSAALLLAALAVSATPAAQGQEAVPKPAALDIVNKDLFTKSLQVAQQAVEMFGESSDRADQERVSAIGYRLAQATQFDEFPFTFHVIDMPEPNAFALPGGHIFVTRSMLGLGLSDDMLAGLLGHEVAHVVEHHGTRMQRRQALLQVLGQALVIGVLVKAHDERRERDYTPPYDPYRRRENPQGTMVEGAAATSVIVSELLMRSYSRDFEREADDEGQRFAAAAGFAPGGLKELMTLMLARLPQTKEYGYWQTHPFFDERVRGADVRAAILTPQPAKPDDDYRRRTQAVLLRYLETAKPKPEVTALLEKEALLAWPTGPRADEIRLGRLHQKRDQEMALIAESRAYGSLIAAYETEAADLERLDREGPLLPKLREELAGFQSQVRELYPRAAEILAGSVYETGFLERFLANFPDAPEVPKAALALGDAYSRLGKQAEAVAMYLKAASAAGDSPEPARARAGLTNLAPVLDSLAALEELAAGTDTALATLARGRIEQVAGSFTDLANGAEYLRRYPNGAKAETITARLNTLAENLYTEVVLYQSVGDSVKALDRIHQILTHAPGSAAAAQIRDQAVVEG